MKWSNYNFVTDLRNGYSVITSTVQFNCIKVSNESCILSTLINCESPDAFSDNIRAYLYDKGFIVDEDFNEADYCTFIREKSVYTTTDLHLTILPTDTCNFKCAYCYENIRGITMDDVGEKSIMRFISKRIRGLNSLRVSWFGGEPLVCKERVLRMTEAINSLCLKSGVLFSGDMTTNGYELDVDTFNRLVRNRILAFQICIDGSEETHNIQRPHRTNNDSYERIIRNLTDIKNKSLSNSFLITLRSNVTRQTEKYLMKHLKLLHSILGNDRRFEIVFQGVRDWGGQRIEKNNIKVLDTKEGDMYRKWYVEAARIGLNSAEKLRLSESSAICEGNYANSFIIYPDCSLHKCTLAYYNDQKHDCGKLGYIKENGEAIIDERKISRWMSRKNIDPKCISCPFFPICKGGSCPYYTNILNKRLTESNHCSCLTAMVESKIMCMNIKEMIPYISD